MKKQLNYFMFLLFISLINLLFAIWFKCLPIALIATFAALIGIALCLYSLRKRPGKNSLKKALDKIEAFNPELFDYL